MALARISCLTGTDLHPDARSSARVLGRSDGVRTSVGSAMGRRLLRGPCRRSAASRTTEPCPARWMRHRRDPSPSGVVPIVALPAGPDTAYDPSGSISSDAPQRASSTQEVHHHGGEEGIEQRRSDSYSSDRYPSGSGDPHVDRDADRRHTSGHHRNSRRQQWRLGHVRQSGTGRRSLGKRARRPQRLGRSQRKRVPTGMELQHPGPPVLADGRVRRQSGSMGELELHNQLLTGLDPHHVLPRLGVRRSFVGDSRSVLQGLILDRHRLAGPSSGPYQPSGVAPSNATGEHPLEADGGARRATDSAVRCWLAPGDSTLPPIPLRVPGTLG